jgi:hypothetical protein
MQNNLYEQWEKALRNTETIRPRIKPLETFSHTQVGYIFLADSAIHKNTTIVRKGNIKVERPALILPPDRPQFKGFDIDNTDRIIDFLLIRGISFPSLKYNNKVSNLDIYNDKLDKAIDFYKNELQKKEDINSGLIIGLEDCWQFSIFIFAAMMASKAAKNDIERLIREYKNKDKDK